jgi:hypothetical protein
MKIVICTLLLIATIGQGKAFAHDGHNVISSETALNIASKSVKQLVFKDLTYDVGKLDASWKLLNESNFNVIEVLENTFIVSASNPSNNKVIYFEIAKNGKLLGVKGTH